MNRKKAIAYKPQIIGYDNNFLSHCLEPNIKSVRRLRREDRTTLVHLKCDNGHTFEITPFEYYIKGMHCIHCIRPGEIGAGTADETLVAMWDEPELDILQISETSKQIYRFYCPFCGSHFQRKMVDIIGQIPKCQECHDGQAPDFSEDFINSIYLFNNSIRRS